GEETVAEAPEPAAEEPSIAVLPFDNMSGDAEQEYIADGLSENIIAILAQTRGMLVISRNSTFTYKGRAVDVRQVAEEQGVRYVLEGSVQLAGERIRVTAQLVDAQDGNHVWSERFDRPVADLFAVQDEITLAIVRAMQVNLTEGGSAIAWHGGTESLEAWRAFETARAHIYNFSARSIADARASLERALEIDPDYAQAEAILSWTYNWDARFFGPVEDEAKNLALAASRAEAAIAKDANVAEAYANLAMIRFLTGSADEAIALAEKTVAVAPSSGFALTAASLVFQYAERYERAGALLERAERLTPIPDGFVLNILAMNRNSLGDYEAAETYARQVIASSTRSHSEGHEQLILALVKQGKLEEAQALVQTQLSVFPAFSVAGFRAKRTRCCRAPTSRMDEFAEAFRAAGVPEHAPGYTSEH
ncbi:MAG: tetratricopeptide repeat protein, partial [Alphaproteobacteria bacterium]|nr:tetratricopeptide repeat protein [Alphaproteobacteria bacterium]